MFPLPSPVTLSSHFAFPHQVTNFRPVESPCIVEPPRPVLTPLPIETPLLVVAPRPVETPHLIEAPYPVVAPPVVAPRPVKASRLVVSPLPVETPHLAVTSHPIKAFHQVAPLVVVRRPVEGCHPAVALPNVPGIALPHLPHLPVVAPPAVSTSSVEIRRPADIPHPVETPHPVEDLHFYPHPETSCLVGVHHLAKIPLALRPCGAPPSIIKPSRTFLTAPRPSRTTPVYKLVISHKATSYSGNEEDEIPPLPNPFDYLDENDTLAGSQGVLDKCIPNVEAKGQTKVTLPEEGVFTALSSEKENQAREVMKNTPTTARASEAALVSRYSTNIPVINPNIPFAVELARHGKLPQTHKDNLDMPRQDHNASKPTYHVNQSVMETQDENSGSLLAYYCQD
ncbi:hypothetical protein AMATHDRAFT_6328 [Amanita thiersii Skay4041]|uniref:Uncharacterized protein n=1 Tax=Amanita thiersii Skay4041 TaxID=703135 RepID=A0A2A9NB60_9AGAR|nr:hypothetical protein AMATHDRAFT_6328 [Amanita thiersii Skay4041]